MAVPGVEPSVDASRKQVNARPLKPPPRLLRVQGVQSADVAHRPVDAVANAQPVGHNDPAVRSPHVHEREGDPQGVLAEGEAPRETRASGEGRRARGRCRGRVGVAHEC